MRRFYPAGIAVLVGLYFLHLTLRVALTFFNPDDVTNLYAAWTDPWYKIIKANILFWSGYTRPLGALLYRLLYALAGFHPRPFHVAAFGLLLVNLALEYRALWLLTASRQIALFTVLIGCFHGRMWDIYASTGTISDILCQTFLLLSLIAYVKMRGGPTEPPLWKQILIFGSLGIAAVDSKEMGVSIPLGFLCYELCFGSLRGVLAKAWRFAPIWTTGVVSAIYIWSRFGQRTPLTGLTAYELVITPQRYLETTQRYVSLLLDGGNFTGLQSILFLAACLILAIAMRSRVMLFGWLYFMVTILPLSFATPREGYVLYIPLPGAALYAASFLISVKNLLVSLLQQGTAARVLDISMVCSLLAGIVLAHDSQRRGLLARHEGPGGEHQMHTITSKIGALYPSLPRGSELLLVNDPLGQEPYVPMFTLRLRYHDPTMKIVKLSWNPVDGPFRLPENRFNHAFLFNGDVMLEVKADTAPISFVTMNSPESILNIVKDVGTVYDGGYPWVYTDPEFRFPVPTLPCRFVMDYIVPDYFLKQTGPLRVLVFIGSRTESIISDQPGEQRYQSALIDSFKTGRLVNIRLHVENPFEAEDGARLGFGIRQAGLVSAH